MASGENEGDELKRNYDYSEIVRRGQFPPDSASLDPETSFSAASDTLPQVLHPFTTPKKYIYVTCKYTCTWHLLFAWSIASRWYSA